MRKVLAIIVACHLLVLSSLASAHLAVDAHDPHESVHVHLGADHNGLEGQEEQDSNFHVHLCVLALNTPVYTVSPSPGVPLTAFESRLVSLSLSPPVPPPNA